MKKYGLRLLAGLITFGVGVVAVIVWMISDRVPNGKRGSLEDIAFLKEQSKELESDSQKIPSGKVEVHFLEFGRIENRPTLKFELRNLCDFPVKVIEGNPDVVRLNGKEIDVFSSLAYSFGGEKTLNSNESLKTEVFADLEIFKVLDEKGDFEFGYTIYPNVLYRIVIWSEPITISEELKKDIRKNAPSFLKPKVKEKETKPPAKSLPQGFAPFKGYKFSPTN